MSASVTFTGVHSTLRRQDLASQAEDAGFTFHPTPMIGTTFIVVCARPVKRKIDCARGVGAIAVSEIGWSALLAAIIPPDVADPTRSGPKKRTGLLATPPEPLTAPITSRAFESARPDYPTYVPPELRERKPPPRVLVSKPDRKDFPWGRGE